MIRISLERCLEFWWEKIEEWDQLEVLGVDLKIILKWIISKLGGGGDVYVIDLSEDRDK
jgi:hypothetical protein